MLQLKPRLFKHKRLIIFGLIITFLNYFVVSYNLFNTSIAIFLLSIAISIILVKNIFLVFLGRKEIKRQMETYILENYDKIGIDNFQTALLENDNIYKTTYLQENLQVVQKIFEKESNSSSVDNKSELLSKIETIISDTFIRIYQKNNSETLITILNYISELYEIANSKEEPVPLSIWDNISREYFKSLSLLSEEQLYNSTFFLPILDMYNGEIISYNISGRPVLNQVLKMLDSAFEKIPNNTGLIFHSDQGWQYQHKKYQKKLLDKGIIQSMSRKGNCLDNSIMENFFGLLKSELFYLRKFESMDEFKLELEKYIDYYNNKRIKSKLKGLSPVQYRIQSSLVA